MAQSQPPPAGLLKKAWEHPKTGPFILCTMVAIGVDTSAAWDPAARDGRSAWHVALAEEENQREYQEQPQGTKPPVPTVKKSITLLQALTRGARAGMLEHPAAVGLVGIHAYKETKRVRRCDERPHWPSNQSS